jgi:hypothetical protein
MGAAVEIEPFREGGTPPPVSRGGKALRFFYGRVALSGAYSPVDGETLHVPHQPGVALRAVVVTPGFDGDREVAWNGSTVRPALRAYDRQRREIGEGVDLSDVTRHVILIYEG